MKNFLPILLILVLTKILPGTLLQSISWLPPDPLDNVIEIIVFKNGDEIGRTIGTTFDIPIEDNKSNVLINLMARDDMDRVSVLSDTNILYHSSSRGKGPGKVLWK